MTDGIHCLELFLSISYLCFCSSKLSSSYYFHRGGGFKDQTSRHEEVIWAGKGSGAEEVPSNALSDYNYLFLRLIQFMVITAFVDNGVERWKIHSGGELFTILYAGLVALGVSFSL